jgi:hypothetical protein
MVVVSLTGMVLIYFLNRIRNSGIIVGMLCYRLFMT